MEGASPLRRVLRNAKQMITGKKDPLANLLCYFTPESTAKEKSEKMKKGGKTKTKKEKRTNKKKAKEEDIDERLATATASPPNDTINLAIEQDVEMKALVDETKMRREELREETRKAEEEEELLKGAQEDRRRRGRRKTKGERRGRKKGRREVTYSPKTHGETSTGDPRRHS